MDKTKECIKWIMHGMDTKKNKTKKECKNDHALDIFLPARATTLLVRESMRFAQLCSSETS